MEIEEKVFLKLEKLETLFSSAMSKVDDRDGVIKGKDEKISELTKKIILTNKDKDEIQIKKSELMDQILEKQKVIFDKDMEIKELQMQIGDLKKLQKASKDVIMGSGFTQDHLQKTISKKDQEIQEMQDRIASVAGGSTGIIYDKDGVVEYIRKSISEAIRQIRLVVPSVQFLEENDLVKGLEGLKPSCAVNIATSFHEVMDEKIIADWKERGFRLTNYTERNLVAIGTNGADVGVSFTKEGTFSGFYTDIDDLVSIFNQALMHAFIQGTKI